MYRESPFADRSSLIQQASAAIMMAKQLVELFVESTDKLRQVGYEGDVEEASILIGQVDQIYSSLWTQLDQASHCVDDLQRDTTEYRALRAALGGGAGQGILQQAGTGCRMLAALLPEVDWTTQIKKQDATPVIDLQRGTKRLVWGTIVAFVAALVYLFVR